MKKKKLRVAFLGGRILGKKCLDILYKYKNKIEVVFIIAHKKDGEINSDWNPKLLPYAKELGFPIYKPAKLTSKQVINKFKKSNIDIILNPFCNRIIPKEIINLPQYGCINFHYGKLPEYQGRFVVSHIILNGEKNTCATAHYIDEKVDTGDIIFEEKVKIRPDETARSLYMKCTDASVTLFEKVLVDLINGKNLPRKQQEGKSTYYPFKELNNCIVDLSWNLEKIKRFIRAVTFPPISYPSVMIEEKKYNIKPE
jgi:methionyl-tRNA formyltransferase